MVSVLLLHARDEGLIPLNVIYAAYGREIN